MKTKKLLAFLLAFSLMLPTVSVSAEETEPTPVQTEISVDEPVIEETLTEEPVEEPAIEDIVTEEPVDIPTMVPTVETPAEETSSHLTLMSEENELELMAEEEAFTYGTFLPLLVEELEVDHLDVSELENPFSRIDEDDDCYEAAMICYYMGWFDNTYFNPEATMYFSNAIEILYAAEQVGTPKAPPTTFITSSDTDYYDKACAVYGAGLFNITEEDYYSWQIYPSSLNTEKLVPIEKNADMSSSALQLDLSDGSITVTSGYKGIYYTQNGETYGTLKGCAIKQTNNTEATTNTITITGYPFADTPVKLTIANLNVSSEKAPIALEIGNLELTLAGVNTLTSSGSAGISVYESGHLTIGGTGELSVSSSKYGAAGIGGHGNYSQGGNVGSITINNGTITATGAMHGAAIGGCEYRSCGTITINGGTIIANGGTAGAGIGSGFQNNYYSDKDNIIINDGTITANSNGGGAAIGGGSRTLNSTITINGGNITATSTGSGAAIGGGDNDLHSETQNNRSITITGGTVVASITSTSKTYFGAAIGGGYDSDGDNITITGGNIIADGGKYGNGIGGGNGGDGGTVSISNAKVTVSGYYHAIGGGITENDFGCDAITIVNSEMTVSHSYEDGSNYQERIFVDKYPLSSAALTSNLIIPVEAHGNSGLSYQWESSADGGNTWTDMEGQTNATLDTPLVDGMLYQCRITNGWGNILRTPSVKGMTLAFSQQPESVVTNLDEMVCLMAVSTCDNVTYQWQKSLDGTDWTDLENENASSIFLNTTLSENGAYYRCIITANNGDTLASDAALISVDSDATTYTTQFYLEKADGSGYELKAQEVTVSESGTSVTAAEKEFEYFEENTALGTHSSTVKSDNSLILSRYYDRCTYEITFDMNGGSDLSAIEAKYGTPVSAPANPTRYGHVFEGWYSDEDLTIPYEFTTMPGGGTTVYAKWSLFGSERGIEYAFNSIGLIDPDTYEKLNSIPQKIFNVEVSVKNLSSTSMDTMILIAYDNNGKMLSTHYMYSNTTIGSTTIMGVSLDNTKGQIAELKAVLVPILGGAVPLAKSISFTTKS